MKTITQEQIKQQLNYNQDTGVFTWAIKTGRVKIGDIAGSRDGRGYWQINVLGKVRKAHRLAWLYMKGRFPKEQIDHINQDRLDNRFSNLREVTNKENNKNSTMQKNNTSGYTGVSFDGKRWVAYITVDDKKKHLGRYKDKNEAILARKIAEKKYGFHENHGKKLKKMEKML